MRAKTKFYEVEEVLATTDGAPAGLGMVEPSQAYEDFIPDTLFPSDNDWGIPTLDIEMEAKECAIPFCIFGEQARTLDMNWNGTLHFYTDDYRFSTVYEHPEKIFNLIISIKICEKYLKKNKKCVTNLLDLGSGLNICTSALAVMTQMLI